MMFTKTLGVAAAFATLASALPSGVNNNVRRNASVPADGSVLITNNLSKDIYAWSVSQDVGPMQVLSANGGTYSEAWRINPDGGGISIKLSTTPDQTDVLQFEYTQATDTIFWDLSCIDMGTNSEFTTYGFSVLPSLGESSSCPSAICAAGDANCAAAYLIPTDDHATHGCPINTGLSLNIGQ